MPLLLVIVGGFIATVSFAGGSAIWALVGIPLFLWGLSMNAKRKSPRPTVSSPPPEPTSKADTVGARSVSSMASTGPFRAGDEDGFEIGLAGESHYQGALRLLHDSLPKHGAKGDRVYFDAKLVPEPENLYDRNAVRVEAPDGAKIGYLPKEHAASYAAVFKRLHQGERIAECRAMACGGSGGKLIGVWISIDSPRELAKRLKTNSPPRTDESFLRPRPTPKDKPGQLQGRHYSTYVSEMGSLKREERHAELEQLLLTLVEATEAESTADGGGVAPAYYRELAILYRKQQRPDDEIAILERYAAQVGAPGASRPELLDRLDRLKSKKSSSAAARPSRG